MTSPSVELQDAVLAALKADAGVGALVGDRIYDKAPANAAFPYITFGPSDYYLDDTDCIALRVETLQIDVWARAEGRLWPARELADAVYNCLHLADLSLVQHGLATLEVESVRVFLEPDNIGAHGVVTLEAMIEATNGPGSATA